MKFVVQEYKPNMAMVQSTQTWPKCQLCGFCHPDDPEKCPRVKSFDRIFKGKNS